MWWEKNWNSGDVMFLKFKLSLFIWHIKTLCGIPKYQGEIRVPPLKSFLLIYDFRSERHCST